MHKQLCYLVLLVFSSVLGQDFAVSNIEPSLLENANSVVRFEKQDITISGVDKMTIRSRSVITVLNKNGNSHLSPFVAYDDFVKVREASAVWYDENGKEKESYKKRDFIDLSAVDGGTLYSDNRLLLLNFTPVEYPYTIEIEYEVETTNTAFIRPFYPVYDYNSSVAKSIFNISYAPGLKFRYLVEDLSNVIQIRDNSGNLTLQVDNMPAFEKEDHSPRFEDYAPHAMFALDEFTLQGVRGQGQSWEQFGRWMHVKLLNNVSSLPEGTVLEIKKLTSGLQSNEEKARKVYQYVQEKTRYISVQIGIGGWKPMPAMDVDKLGYGDCKALTNYTKALLEVAGVPSYYTVVYGGGTKRNLNADFPSLQGNHVILAVPQNDDYIWLECTSQTVPFGYIAGFTDDRDVLMVTPEGGKFAHTRKYSFSENGMKTYGECTLDAAGNISVEAKIETSGIQYDKRYELETQTKDDQELYYKGYWDYVDNIDIGSVKLENNRAKINLVENVSFQAESYSGFTGEDMILNVNVLNRANYIPKRYSDRKLPLVITRGFVDEDEVFISLPEGFKMQSEAAPISVETKFGKYDSSISVDGDGRLRYNRKFELYEGTYDKEDYDAYRKFRRKVSKSDNQKIILTNK